MKFGRSFKKKLYLFIFIYHSSSSLVERMLFQHHVHHYCLIHDTPFVNFYHDTNTGDKLKKNMNKAIEKQMQLLVHRDTGLCEWSDGNENDVNYILWPLTFFTFYEAFTTSPPSWTSMGDWGVRQLSTTINKTPCEGISSRRMLHPISTKTETCWDCVGGLRRPQWDTGDGFSVM